MQKKKVFKRLLAAGLALLLVVGGIGAYFTSSDVKSDAYTIGQIEVEVVGDNDLYKAEHLTPNYEWSFTRSVKNVGINDAYVFMAVTLPTEEIFTHDLDGVHTDNTAALTQLFTYGTDNVAGVSSEWAPVTAGKFGDYDIAAINDAMKNKSGDYAAIRNNNTITYVYAYVGDGANLARLSADAETDSIFDIMKFVNASDTVAQYNVEATTGKVQTQVFAIQADNVLETTYMEGRNDDGSDAINAVWAVLNNAANDKHLSVTDANDEKVLIPVISKDKVGNDLNASATIIEGAEKEELLDALEQSGLAEADDVDYLIDVKSDDFEDLADTTFDMSKVAKDGDTVVILHYNEETSEWEYIATETVVEGKVNGDFSSYSPVALIVIPKEEKEKIEGYVVSARLFSPSFAEERGATPSPMYTQLANDGYELNERGNALIDSALHGWLALSDIEIGQGDSCLSDVAGSYQWTSYEVVSETETSATIKLICDTVDFSNVKLEDMPCGCLSYEYDDPSELFNQLAIEGTDLTWTITLEKNATTTDNSGKVLDSVALMTVGRNANYPRSPILYQMSADGINVQGVYHEYMEGPGYIQVQNTYEWQNHMASSAWSDIKIASYSDEGCLGGDSTQILTWNKYELISKTDATATVKLICDTYNFTGLAMQYPCGHTNAVDPNLIITDNGALEWTIEVTLEDPSAEYYLVGYSLEEYSRVNDMLLEDGITLDFGTDGYIAPMTHGFHEQITGDYYADNLIALVDTNGCIKNLRPFNFHWDGYTVIDETDTTITLKLSCSSFFDFSDVHIEDMPCSCGENGADGCVDFTGIAVEGTALTWTYTFNKAA